MAAWTFRKQAKKKSKKVLVGSGMSNFAKKNGGGGLSSPFPLPVPMPMYLYIIYIHNTMTCIINIHVCCTVVLCLIPLKSPLLWGFFSIDH